MAADFFSFILPRNPIGLQASSTQFSDRRLGIKCYERDGVNQGKVRWWRGVALRGTRRVGELGEARTKLKGKEERAKRGGRSGVPEVEVQWSIP